MSKFLQFLMDGLRLMAWLILMLVLFIIYIFVRPGYKTLPHWLEIIVNPLLTSTVIVLVFTSFCWVFGLKIFSQDSPPDWYGSSERLFNFRSFSNFLRGLGCILGFICIMILISYFAGPMVREIPEEPMDFGQKYFDSN